MNKNRWIFLLIAAAVIGMIYFWKGADKQSPRVQNYDFKIVDTASVARIELITKKPDTARLQRTESGWIINDRYRARPSGIRTLLRTLHDQEMKHFVARDRMDRVVKYMATGATQVRVYDRENRELLHFFVGGNTPDQLGTYMMISGADQPYAVHIPGFNGFLSSRYFTEEHLWRDKVILRAPLQEINRVTLGYPQNPKASFQLARNGNRWTMTDFAGQPLDGIDSTATDGFLRALDEVLIEGWVRPEDRVWPQRDSILNSTPVFELEVNRRNGSSETIRGFYKLAWEGETDASGALRAFDKDRLYAQSPDGEFVLIQRYAWVDILREASYFQLKPSTGGNGE